MRSNDSKKTTGITSGQRLAFEESPTYFGMDPLELIRQADTTGNDSLFPDIRALRRITEICRDYKFGNPIVRRRVSGLAGVFRLKEEELEIAYKSEVDLTSQAILLDKDAELVHSMAKFVHDSKPAITSDVIRSVPALTREELRETEHPNRDLYESWIDLSYGRTTVFAARSHFVQVAVLGAEYMLSHTFGDVKGGT
jgi:hypothetical protein